MSRNNRPALSSQIIWLTGASSGIGEALVPVLARQCQHLFISARNREKLEELASTRHNITALPADITVPESMQAAAAQIEQSFGYLDTLIANAGSCEYLDVQAFDSELIKRVMDTNFMGLVNSIAAALPLIQQSRHGYLVAMSSSVTSLPLPRAEAYGASKAAVNYFMAALRNDLHRQAIDVSIIAPGFVKTPLTDRNDFPMPMCISAADAALAIVAGLQQRPWEIHFPKRFTWPLKCLGLLPVHWGLRLTRLLARHNGSPHESL
jgi:NADP-dependent 3-hydroxy acid dehydrogenase YdfG